MLADDHHSAWIPNQPLRTDPFGTVAPYIEQFAKEVRENARVLLRYINSGYCRLTEEEKNVLRAQLRASDGPFLSAVNQEGRIRFYKPWALRGYEFTMGQKLYLVTFARLKDARSLAGARGVDIRSLQAWIRQMMLGFDYLGFIEIALYTNLRLGLLPPPLVHPHGHLLVRNCNPNRLQEVMDRINEKFESLVPGCPAADMRPIQPGDQNVILHYMVKEPSERTRVKPVRRKVQNPETREFAMLATGKYFHDSDPASPGLQLKARSVLETWHMDKLAFAGGEGRSVLGAIREEALRGLSTAQRRGRQFTHGSCFEPDAD